MRDIELDKIKHSIAEIKWLKEYTVQDIPFNIHYVGNNGTTALHLAAFFGNTSLVKFLLQEKLNVNQQITDSGLTALHYASLNHNVDLIKLLITYDANPLIMDRNDKKAIDYSYKNMDSYSDDNMTIKELLLAAEQNFIASINDEANIVPTSKANLKL